MQQGTQQSQRVVTGTLAMHIELEEKIAAFKHTEACVVFQSGFTANAGTVSSVLTPNDHRAYFRDRFEKVKPLLDAAFVRPQ